ncbi:MAG: sigma-70 family RNA polymerase sigma factor [Acidobacteriota bacterium]|nr:MAG: sigma-70 family RNA polymerase sigma factor [Acidobacteriota bacterium]
MVRRKSVSRPSRDAGGPRSQAEASTTYELLDQARQGNRDAEGQLCQRYLERLRRWARGRLPRFARSLVDTEDIVQEVLTATICRAALRKSPAPVALQAYVRTAVNNRIRREIRRARRTPFKHELDDEIAGNERSPLSQAIDRELLDRYDAALGRLRPREREAIVARLELGCSYAEVADALGAPSAEAARKSVSRALLSLAAEMDRHV